MTAKIGIFVRTDSDMHPGGDTVQLRAIERLITEEGFGTRLILSPFTEVDGIDLGIILNLTRPFEAYIQALQCCARNIPYVLFPVFWNLDSLKFAGTVTEELKNLIPIYLKKYIRRYRFLRSHLARNHTRLIKMPSEREAVYFVLQHAAYICPNSQAETAHLTEIYSLEGAKFQVIHNGFEPFQVVGQDMIPDLPQKYVCCVGAIGPRKNQLRLVHAANETGVNLVIVGDNAFGAERYGRKVRSKAGETVWFIPHQPIATAREIMARSNGHIQPSYIETPGLASLEAASEGVPIGVSDVGPVREYFKDWALYCDPTDISSICNCLLALQTSIKPDYKMSDFIHQHYRWETALLPLLPIIRELTSENN